MSRARFACAGSRARFAYAWQTGGVALLALPALAACHPKAVGELVLVVQTNLSLPKDIDTIRIEAENAGVPKFMQDYDALGTSGGMIQLPATLGLLAPDDPSDAIQVIVSGFSGGSGVGGKLLLQREAVTTVPPSEVVTLEMRIDFLCLGQAKLVSGTDAQSSCASGQTCIAGSCVGDKVDSSKLNAYDGNQLDEGGSCFDGVTCWSNPSVVADLDPKTCSFAAPTVTVNVALQTQGAGICGPAGCFVTLDADDPEGWTSKDGRIVLPPAVCAQIKQGQVVDVVTEPVSAACNGKSLSLPTCGTWSGATHQPVPYVGPVALAGGQPRPVAVALLGGDIYWTNGGIKGTTGSLASVGPAGGTPSGVATAGEAPRALVTDGGSALFWTDSPGTAGAGAVYRAYDSKVVQLVTKQNAPEGIAFAKVGGTGKIFWSDFHDGTISVIDAATPTATPPPPIVTGQMYPYRVAADAEFVYWTNEGTLDTPNGSVVRYQHTASKAPQMLAMKQETPRAIALDVDQNGKTVAVYWANFAPKPDGAIMRVAISGGTPGSAETIASGLDYPNGIAVNGDLVYWTNRGDGTVMSAPLGPNPATPKTLATGRHAPGSLAINGANLYWVDEGSSSAESGAIIKLGK